MMKAVTKNKEGIILVNKPKGLTSHDIVDIARRRLKIRRIGHAGTLDPLAEGLLIILVGRATKLFSQFVNFDKEYTGTLKLGEATATGDSQGEILKSNSYRHLSRKNIEDVFSLFRGEIEQVPPMVSALRVGGRRLYQLARQGVTIRRNPRKIKIHFLKIIKINLPFVEFYVYCSKGTYVRKIAEDIGEELGCGAHIVKIKRLSVGPFRLEEAVDLEKIDEAHLRTFSA